MHQPSGMNVRSVLWGGAAIAIGVMLAALVSYLLWNLWSAPSGAQLLGGPNTRLRPAVTPPVLESAPQIDRTQYFAEKQKKIGSWEWIDRQKGIARIPVEEAMRIMAARGQDGRSQKGQP